MLFTDVRNQGLKLAAEQRRDIRFVHGEFRLAMSRVATARLRKRVPKKRLKQIGFEIEILHASFMVIDHQGCLFWPPREVLLDLI